MNVKSCFLGTKSKKQNVINLSSVQIAKRVVNVNNSSERRFLEHTSMLTVQMDLCYTSLHTLQYVLFLLKGQNVACSNCD